MSSSGDTGSRDMSSGWDRYSRAMSRSGDKGSRDMGVAVGARISVDIGDKSNRGISSSRTGEAN